ncbi:PucR family transcriptional regulator [Protofrankia coriariae]|nr:helix-turn-helix domain-containing protein [Protofrankia coriariae]
MDLDANAAFITEQIMEIVIPDRADDEGFRKLMARNAYDNLNAMWRIIAGLDELEVTPPRGAIAFNDKAAEVGVPLGQFERIYRVGVGLVWTLWFRAAKAYAQESGTDTGIEELLAGPSMIIHAYIDGQISTLLERFETAQAEHQRTREQLRLSILRQALDGPPALTGPAVERALGIVLDAEHVSVALRTESFNAESPLARELCGATGSKRVLHYRYDAGLWVLWLSHPDGFDDARLAALERVLTGSGLRCAVGDPAWGASGLTSSSGEALVAIDLQARLGEAAASVVAFRDLRLESLLLAEPVKARHFIRAELRDLDAGGARRAQLRETAQVWLESGSNVSTAQILGVHEHTVRNRITTIQKLIGRPLTSRRTELLVALRLRRLLGVSS